MLNNAIIAEITALGAPSQTRVFDSRSYLRITASTSVSTSTDSISCASSSFSASVSGDFLLFLKTTEAFSFRLIIKGDLLFQEILGTQTALGRPDECWAVRLQARSEKALQRYKAQGCKMPQGAYFKEMPDENKEFPIKGTSIS